MTQIVSKETEIPHFRCMYLGTHTKHFAYLSWSFGTKIFHCTKVRLSCMHVGTYIRKVWLIICIKTLLIYLTKNYGFMLHVVFGKWQGRDMFFFTSAFLQYIDSLCRSSFCAVYLRKGTFHFILEVARIFSSEILMKLCDNCKYKLKISTWNLMISCPIITYKVSRF
jgi:hypothetical protein